MKKLILLNIILTFVSFYTMATTTLSSEIKKHELTLSWEGIVPKSTFPGVSGEFLGKTIVTSALRSEKIDKNDDSRKESERTEELIIKSLIKIKNNGTTSSENNSIILNKINVFQTKDSVSNTLEKNRESSIKINHYARINTDNSTESKYALMIDLRTSVIDSDVPPSHYRVMMPLIFSVNI
ncbi:hypothetical protein E2G82_23265 [Salmonella enterica subsp. enterica serovar Ramatgan]|uniref:Uncharacterized protein n=1 Tax=Salmonella enterica TaxID=28901 RepID=A0A742ZJ76_SALER|nr:hypothetical protein [Salmonella enterica subsp. enterica serovar Enteritidis]EAO8183947.1 hypothetical protein [Salmonella enterica]ECI8027079.1 hypothetical protein [Salmonella enterica subsp. enterica serovar Ramatgan]EBA4670504.1 hypothetical protein [Salmonella enterica]EBB0848025.1 hypothetical protein [Salmonella enterica]